MSYRIVITEKPYIEQGWEDAIVKNDQDINPVAKEWAWMAPMKLFTDNRRSSLFRRFIGRWNDEHAMDRNNYSIDSIPKRAKV